MWVEMRGGTWVGQVATTVALVRRWVQTSARMDQLKRGATRRIEVWPPSAPNERWSAFHSSPGNADTPADEWCDGHARPVLDDDHIPGTLQSGLTVPQNGRTKGF